MSLHGFLARFTLGHEKQIPPDEIEKSHGVQLQEPLDLLNRKFLRARIWWKIEKRDSYVKVRACESFSCINITSRTRQLVLDGDGVYRDLLGRQLIAEPATYLQLPL